MNNEPDYDNLYFEEKKMHTPQVGDVWINTKTNKLGKSKANIDDLFKTEVENER